jgi:hypothetical protein
MIMFGAIPAQPMASNASSSERPFLASLSVAKPRSEMIWVLAGFLARPATGSFSVK